jgi:tryptophan 2,3-dioxygenase
MKTQSINESNLSLGRRLRWWASDVVNVARGAIPSAIAPRKRNLRMGPLHLDAIQKSVAWLNDYIGKPHPELGRNGDICPFVRTALRKQRMSFVVADHITVPDGAEIKSLVLFEAWRLLQHLDESDRFSELVTTNILFPELKGDAESIVHDVHSQTKSSLMRRGVMIAAFFPNYDKPAIYNENFKLYKSPFPVIVVRPMALHDIMFLTGDGEAFREYHRRFAERYHAGTVSEEFGYPARFRDAELRFGLAKGAPISSPKTM